MSSGPGSPVDQEAIERTLAAFRRNASMMANRRPGREQLAGMADVWVQWKGTSVCADFHCGCGAEGHIDAMFAYSVRCGTCGQVWVLPQTLPLVRLEDASEIYRTWHSDGVPVEMDETPPGPEDGGEQ